MLYIPAAHSNNESSTGEQYTTTTTMTTFKVCLLQFRAILLQRNIVYLIHRFRMALAKLQKYSFPFLFHLLRDTMTMNSSRLVFLFCYTYISSSTAAEA